MLHSLVIPVIENYHTILGADIVFVIEILFLHSVANLKNKLSPET